MKGSIAVSPVRARLYSQIHTHRVAVASDASTNVGGPFGHGMIISSRSCLLWFTSPCQSETPFTIWRAGRLTPPRPWDFAETQHSTCRSRSAARDCIFARFRTIAALLEKAVSASASEVAGVA